MSLHMLTTVDNPFSPFTQFEEWNAYDQMKGYNTLAFLARVRLSSEDLSDAEQQMANESAIDEIIRENPNGLYRRLEVPDSIVQT